MGMGYIKFPCSFRITLANANGEQFKRLVFAMLDLAETGEEPDFSPDQPEYFLWPQCRANVVDSIESYEKIVMRNRTNGAKRKKAQLGKPTLVEKDPELYDEL